MNEQNLRPYTKGDPRASIQGRKGQAASVKSRRRNANIAKTMSNLIANKTMILDGEEMTYEAAICITMVKEALAGNVAAAKFVADAVDNALKSKEVKAKIKKLEAEAKVLEAQQESGIAGIGRVVIVDDIRADDQTE